MSHSSHSSLDIHSSTVQLNRTCTLDREDHHSGAAMSTQALILDERREEEEEEDEEEVEWSRVC